MALSTNTTLLPGYTIVTDSVTGGIAVIRTTDDSTSYEYTIANEIADKLTIIATHLESISNSLNVGSTPVGTILSDIAQASENSARALENMRNTFSKDIVTVQDPLAWMGLMSVYKLYAEDASGNLDPTKLESLKSYKAKIDELIASLNS